MLISVIVTTYNRCSHLGLVLDSLAKQKRDGFFEYEVIVVDNDSIDGTKAVVDAELSKWDGRLTYFLEPNKGKSHALNKGVYESKGDIIAFTDDDVMVDPEWLLSIFQCFQAFSCDGVGGRVLPEYPPETPQWVKDNAVKLAGAVVIYDYGRETMKLSASMYPFIGANYAFKRNIFEDYGLFCINLGPGTPSMGEDTEFIRRLMIKGKTLYYCGKALIWHPFDPQRLELRRIAKWHVALGRFDAQREIQQGQTMVYCSSVPRYLIKGIIVDFLGLAAHCLNRFEFFNSWRSFFRKVGMIREYRQMKRKAR